MLNDSGLRQIQGIARRARIRMRMEKPLSEWRDIFCLYDSGLIYASSYQRGSMVPARRRPRMKRNATNVKQRQTGNV